MSTIPGQYYGSPVNRVWTSSVLRSLNTFSRTSLNCLVKGDLPIIVQAFLFSSSSSSCDSWLSSNFSVSSMSGVLSFVIYTCMTFRLRRTVLLLWRNIAQWGVFCNLANAKVAKALKPLSSVFLPMEWTTAFNTRAEHKSNTVKTYPCPLMSSVLNK